MASLRNFLGGIFRVSRDRSGNTTYFLEGDGFINSGRYLDMSFDNPVLMTIIAIRCKIYSQMKIRHVDSEGKDIKNSEYLKLLSSPNFFQSQEDFLYQLKWFQSAVGTNLTYEIKPFSTSTPKAIYNLIPSEIDLNKSNKVKSFISTNKELKDFQERQIKYKLDGQEFSIKLADLIPFYDLANGLQENTFMQSPSRVQGISKVLENIDENIKSKNMNLKMSQKYLATNKTVNNGVTPQITKDDRSTIENIIARKSMQITNGNIEVKHLVSDFKKLFLDEMLANDALTCLLAFEMNRDMLNYFSNGATTHNNFEQGMLSYIQNSVQSDANSDMNSFSQQWGLFDKGQKLIASYDHLPIMQTVMNKKIETLMAFIGTVEKELELKTLTEADAIKKIQAFKLTLGL